MIIFCQNLFKKSKFIFLINKNPFCLKQTTENFQHCSSLNKDRSQSGFYQSRKNLFQTDKDKCPSALQDFQTFNIVMFSVSFINVREKKSLVNAKLLQHFDVLLVLTRPSLNAYKKKDRRDTVY